MKIGNFVSPVQLPPQEQAPSPLQRRNGIRRLCPQEKASTLIGKTISPQTAFRMRELITVDSRGMITDVHAKHLSSRDYAEIASTLTTPLTHRPQPAQDLIRTPKEALLALTLAVAESSLDGADKLPILERLKYSWLDNNSSEETTRQQIAQLQFTLSSEPRKHQVLLTKVEEISNTLEKEFYITKRNDNYYGRLFDTAFSEYVIDNPTAQSHHINEVLTKKLWTDFNSYTPAIQDSLCKQIHKRMLADPPAWRERIKESQAFINDPVPQHFAAMLQSQDRYAIPLSLSLAVKYMLVAPNFNPMTQAATRHYLDVISGQRQHVKTLKENIRSDQHGLLLPHQSVPQQQAHLRGTNGIRPIDLFQPVTLAITPHNQAALHAERSMGIGMSGSTNLLNHLFQRLAQEGEVFSMEHARTLTAAYLTFSGGHSLNEAYTVFSYDSTKRFTPLCFNTLANTAPYNADAVNHAYEKVLETCSILSKLQHSH